MRVVISPFPVRSSDGAGVHGKPREALGGEGRHVQLAGRQHQRHVPGAESGRPAGAAVAAQVVARGTPLHGDHRAGPEGRLHGAEARTDRGARQVRDRAAAAARTPLEVTNEWTDE